jgi:hypothetical protein
LEITANALLPAKEIAPALKNAGIDNNAPPVLHGEMMLHSFVATLSDMADIVIGNMKSI